MPSSTSNSNQRVPQGQWGRTWLLAVVICLLVFVGFELFWRHRGFEPMLKDNASVWGQVRSQITEDNATPVVLLGSSRMHWGINPKILASYVYSRQVLDLAIDDGSPLPILEDLAHDPLFRGTIVCGVTPTMFFDVSGEKEKKVRQWVSEYHHASLCRQFEVPLRAAFEKRFVVLLPTLVPAFVLKDLALGELPKPHYVMMHSNRYMSADSSKVNVTKLANKWKRKFSKMGEVPSADEIRQRFVEIDQWTQRIQSRGGEVVFLRLPSSGQVRNIEEQRFARKDFWEPFARSTSGLAIHFEDLVADSQDMCFDGSHLESADADNFSQTLGLALDQRLGLINLSQ